jgi:hypothetical protein
MTNPHWFKISKTDNRKVLVEFPVGEPDLILHLLHSWFEQSSGGGYSNQKLGDNVACFRLVEEMLKEVLLPENGRNKA